MQARARRSRPCAGSASSFLKQNNQLLGMAGGRPDLAHHLPAC